MIYFGNRKTNWKYRHHANTINHINFIKTPKSLFITYKLLVYLHRCLSLQLHSDRFICSVFYFQVWRTSTTHDSFKQNSSTSSEVKNQLFYFCIKKKKKCLFIYLVLKLIICIFFNCIIVYILKWNLNIYVWISHHDDIIIKIIL